MIAAGAASAVESRDANTLPPALCKKRKERGTHGLDGAHRNQNLRLGHPPCSIPDPYGASKGSTMRQSEASDTTLGPIPIVPF